MRRALLTAACLLLTALAAAPSASATHVEPQCNNIHWDPAPPPGWNTFCVLDAAAAQVAHNVLVAIQCLGGYDPVVHGLGYVIDCAQLL